MQLIAQSYFCREAPRFLYGLLFLLRSGSAAEGQSTEPLASDRVAFGLGLCLDAGPLYSEWNERKYAPGFERYNPYLGYTIGAGIQRFSRRRPRTHWSMSLRYVSRPQGDQQLFEGFQNNGMVGAFGVRAFVADGFEGRHGFIASSTRKNGREYFPNLSEVSARFQFGYRLILSSRGMIYMSIGPYGTHSINPYDDWDPRLLPRYDFNLALAIEASEGVIVHPAQYRRWGVGLTGALTYAYSLTPRTVGTISMQYDYARYATHQIGKSFTYGVGMPTWTTAFVTIGVQRQLNLSLRRPSAE